MKQLALQFKNYIPSKFFSEFTTNPSVNYYRLLSNYKNYRLTPNAAKFWKKWELLKPGFQSTSSIECREFIDRIDQLKVLVDFENILIEENKLLKVKIKEKKLSTKRFLSQVLCLYKEGFPSDQHNGIEYKFADLMLVYQLIQKDNLFAEQNETDFSVESVEFVRDVLHNYAEQYFCSKMFDYFVLGDFNVRKESLLSLTDGIIYGLDLRKGEAAENNSYLLSKTKQVIKEKLTQKMLDWN